MYIILVNDDNTLSASQKQRIIQNSKLVDDLWFLVNPTYNGHDLTNSTVLLEYVKPVSREYKTETLVLSEDKYKDHLKYVLPVDTEFTKEAGTLEMKLSFIYVDMDPDGNVIQRVRKTAPSIKVEIIPIERWCDIIPDSALSALDQRIIMMDGQIKAIAELNSIAIDSKADNIKYNEDENSLQLMAGENVIGDKVILNNGELTSDGVPVVDLEGIMNDSSGEDDDIVEF